MKKVISIISWVLSGLLFIFALFILITGITSAKQGKPLKLFGYSYSVVVTDSMEPTINVNDIIVIKDCEFDELEVGDIIVFYNPIENKNISHRIYNILEDNSIETKGDNPRNSVDSFKVTEEYYLGKVSDYGKFLGIGKLIVNGKTFFFIVLILIFLYVIISETINIYKTLLEKKKLELEEQKKLEDEKLREQLKEELKEELKNKKIE